MSGIVNSLGSTSGILGTTEGAGGVPSGTKMIFNQTAAPTAWTKVTGSGNDTALRVTTGTVGTGGSVAFETCLASHTPTISTPTASSGAVSAHTLAENEIPAHRHGTYGATGGSGGPNNTTTHGAGYVGFVYTQQGTVGQTHTHSMTQPTISTPTCSALNLDVSYCDVIIATKD